MHDDLEAIGRHFPNVSIASEFFDHLNGVLFIDHLGRKKQKRLKAKLRQIRQEYAEIPA